MEITFNNTITNKLEKISKMTGYTYEKLICDMVEEKIKDYCHEDGTFQPILAELHVVDANGVDNNMGPCYVLREQKVWNFDCCKIFHDGKLKMVNKAQIVFPK